MSEENTSIVERIGEKARSQAESIISTAGRVAEREVQSAERRARTRQRVARRELEERVAARKAQAQTEAASEVQRLKLQRRHELAEEVLSDALAALRLSPRDEDYLKLLARLAAEAAESLGGGRIEILVCPSDREFLDAGGRFDRLAAEAAEAAEAAGETGAELALSDETIETAGGLVGRTADGRVCFHNTFEEIARRLHDRLRERITQELFQVET